MEKLAVLADIKRIQISNNVLNIGKKSIKVRAPGQNPVTHNFKEFARLLWPLRKEWNGY